MDKTSALQPVLSNFTCVDDLFSEIPPKNRHYCFHKLSNAQQKEPDYS